MFKKFAIAAVLVAASTSAFAAGPQPFYAGIDVASTKIDGFGREGGYGAYFGYKFNPSVAIEGGYHRVADTDYRYNGVRGDLTLDMIDLSVIGTLPLSNGFDLYGRLGYNRLEADADIGGFSGKSHESGGLYGLGLGYAFSPVVHARLEVQRPANDATRIVAGVGFSF
jgi:OOP family OmpA-OmpF porin